MNFSSETSFVLSLASAAKVVLASTSTFRELEPQGKPLRQVHVRHRRDEGQLSGARLRDHAKACPNGSVFAADMLVALKVVHPFRHVAGIGKQHRYLSPRKVHLDGDDAFHAR